MFLGKKKCDNNTFKLLESIGLKYFVYILYYLLITNYLIFEKILWIL